MFLRDTDIYLRVYTPSLNTENGDIVFLRNAGIYLRVCTTSQPKRTTSSSSLPREPQISPLLAAFTLFTGTLVPWLRETVWFLTFIHPKHLHLHLTFHAFSVRLRIHLWYRVV
jgi:hypothetical protein